MHISSLLPVFPLLKEWLVFSVLGIHPVTTALSSSRHFYINETSKDMNIIAIGPHEALHFEVIFLTS